MPSASFDIIVLGGLNSDFTLRGSALPRPGETVDGREFEQGAGGKGGNQAVWGARLGARTAMLARVGPDERGTALIGALETHGVDTRHIGIDAETPTGAAVIMVDERGRKQIMAFPGANHRLVVTDILNAADAIGRSGVLLTQLECPIDATIQAVRIAFESGVRVVLDTAPAAQIPEEMYPMLTCIRSNATEAETLTGIPGIDRDSARRAAQRYLDRGVSIAAVQAGEEGDIVLSRDEEIWLPRIPVQSIDATGAGDAFTAALTAMIALNEPLRKAARFANAAAALATTSIGAQSALPSRAEVERLADTIDGKPEQDRAL